MDVLTYGIISGSIILLGSLGFSLTLKTERFLNIAHGQMLLFGAYAALFLNQRGLDMVTAAAVATVASGLLGVLIHRVLYEPVRSRGILVLLFTSVGVAYVLNGLIGAFAGKRMQAYDLPAVRALTIGDRPIMTIYELLIVLIAVAAAIGIHLFLTRTWTGKSIRAVSDNYDLARVRGFNPRRVSDYVWFIASALAGLAGVFTGIIGSLHLEIGWQQTIIILAATVLGGLGSVYGVMLASFVLGIGMELGITVLPSSYRMAIAFLIIILVLFLRPQGLESLWSRHRERIA
ncbi:MAG: branched-chain amino acid ABC transporter permease [Parvibaculaceae bacterium]